MICAGTKDFFRPAFLIRMIWKGFRIDDKIYHKKFREGIIVEKNANIVKIKFADGERSLDYKVCMVKNIIWKI